MNEHFGRSGDAMETYGFVEEHREALAVQHGRADVHARLLRLLPVSSCELTFVRDRLACPALRESSASSARRRPVLLIVIVILQTWEET